MRQGGVQRREPRRFVPPPWEREQFERFERERAVAHEDTAVRDAAEENRTAAAPPVTAEPRVLEGSAGASDPAQIEAMLEALRAEEPAAVQDAGKVALIVSGFIGVLGIILVIWGMVALARSAGGGPAGVMGATIMSMMGGVLSGLAVWLGMRGLKQRGERT